MADIELINPVLGVRPFILVEFEDQEDGTRGFSIQHGGGVDTAQEVFDVFAMLATAGRLEKEEETRDGA